MATTQAIAAVSEAIIHLLESKPPPHGFGANQLKFNVVQAKDFEIPPTLGITLFLYHISHNMEIVNRPPGRINPDGSRQPPPLPLDLHFLVTAWAKNAGLQHEIVGWMMRMLEDSPILPATLLNRRIPGLFQPEETVEIILNPLTAEEILRIWERVTKRGYQISVPYLARNLRLGDI
jgi:hypothetical protein